MEHNKMMYTVVTVLDGMGATLNGKDGRLFSSDASLRCFEPSLLDAE